MPMDFLAIALCELANISERRIYKLISGTRGLPSFSRCQSGLEQRLHDTAIYGSLGGKP